MIEKEMIVEGMIEEVIWKDDRKKIEEEMIEKDIEKEMIEKEVIKRC